MLEGLVTWVLNNYLGKYVENLNTDQLSIALLSGEVELDNLPLRKDALRHIGLPIEVRAGFIGKVKLQIPVRQIRSAPWLIVIERLYLVAGPFRLNEWDSEREEEICQEMKQSALDAEEARWRAETETGQQTGYYASSYSSWISYGSGLVTNIVENLQLQIKDVHIRYEDDLTVANRAFACGLTIDSLSAQSCDSNWTPRFMQGDRSAASFKLVELQSLAVYWDALKLPRDLLGGLDLSDLAVALSKTISMAHQYLVKPVSAHAHIKRDRNEQPLRSRNTPRIVCDLHLEEVPLALIDWQYEEMVHCVQGLDDIARLRRYRLYRPSCSVAENPRAWWIYAIRCSMYPDCPSFCLPRVTWDDCLLRAKENVKYVDICAKYLAAPAAALGTENKALKDKVEWNRGLDELKVLRQIAMRRVPVNTVTTNSSQGRSMLLQWFPQWWGWYSTADAQIQQTDSTAKEQLEDEILDALADSVENNTLLKRDTVFGQFSFTLKQGTFYLYTASDPFAERVSMMELQYENVKLSFESRPRNASHMFQIILGAVYIRDKLTPDTQFPVLIAPQGNRESSTSIGGVRSRGFNSRLSKLSPAQNVSSTEPLFQLNYEQKPFGSNADFKLHVKSQSLDVVYNPGVAHWLTVFLTGPHQQRLKLPTKSRIGANIMRNWEQILEGDLTERKSWDLHLDISAPQIIIVEQFNDRNAAVAVIDFGRLQLNNADDSIDGIAQAAGVPSSLNTRDSEDDENFMTPCSTPPGSEASDSESQTMCTAMAPSSQSASTLNESMLHQKLYDRYSVELNDLQILVGKVRDNWKYAHTKGTSTLHVLDSFNISFQIERRAVYTSDPLYPSLTLNANLPKLVVHINEQKIATMRKLYDIIVNTGLPSPFRSPQSQNAPAVETQTNDDMTAELSSVASDSITHDTNREGSKLIMLQFTVDQMALEVQSRGRSVAELQVAGVRVAFTQRTGDASISLSVHGLLLVDALQTFGPDFELLVASHKHVGMDSVSGSLRDSEPCSPTSPGSPDPSTSRIKATSPVALTQALSSLTMDATPGRAVSPTCVFASSPPGSVIGLGGANRGSFTALERLDADALITVEVLIIGGPDPLQHANIQFNNLDIIANQETIVELMGFARRVFPQLQPTAKRVIPESPTLINASTQSGLFRDGQESLSVEEESRVLAPTKMEIMFDFHRLNVLLLRGVVKDGVVQGRKIATATMSGAKIQATVDTTLVVEGSLGGLQVLDLTPEGHVHQRIISVGKDPLAETAQASTDLLGTLNAEVYSMNHAHSSQPENDHRAFSFCVKRLLQCTDDNDTADVTIRMASVWYTHSPQFVMELESCATEFKQYLTNLARSIRTAATDMAIGLVHARAEAIAQSLYMNARLSHSLYGDVTSPRKRRRSFSQSSDQIDGASGHASSRCTMPHTPYSPADDDTEVINIRLDMILDSPMVVLPRSANSSEVFVAHLGKITVNNKESENFSSSEQKPQTEYSESSFWENLTSRTERYNIEIRDMNLYSLDTTSCRATASRSGCSLGRTEQLYCCEDAGQPILHDTVLRLTVDRQLKFRGPDNEDSFSQLHINDMDLRGENAPEMERCDHIQVSGSIITPLKVSMTRAHYEQFLDTFNTLVMMHKTPEKRDSSMGSSKLPTLGEIAEEDTTGVTTLNMDPKLRARMFTGVTKQELPKLIMLKVSFKLPEFTIELRGNIGNGEQGLVDLSFRDFVIEYEKSHRYETNIQVSLRSLLMEDLQRHPDSKHRCMVVSSAVNELPTGPSYLSHSCPDLVSHPITTSSSRGSLPDHLETERVIDAPPPMLTFCPKTPPPSPSRRQRPHDNLVLISCLLVDPAAPNFETHYNSLQRTTSVDFNCLDLVISVESWVVVLDFFGADSSRDELQSTVNQNVQTADQTAYDHPQGNTELTVEVRSLTLVLARPEREVAKANISNLSLCILNRGALSKDGGGATHPAGLQQRSVSGRLGSMSLLDLTSHGQLYRERFVTSGQQALNFNYVRLNESEAANSSFDAQLSLEMSSVLYVHTKRFIFELQAFYADFSQLQAVMSSIRAAAHGQVVKQQNYRSTRLSIELHAGAPVILLPVSSRSSDVLVADLGKLTVSNSFKLANTEGTISVLRDTTKESPCLLNVMFIDLVNMDLYAGKREVIDHASPSRARSGGGHRGSVAFEYLELGGYCVVKQGRPLLTEKCHLKLQVERNLDAYYCHSVADYSVHGTLSTLDGTLDLSQYKLIRGLLTYNLGEVTLDLMPSVEQNQHVNTEQNTMASISEVWTLSSIRLDLLNVTLRLQVERGEVALACINFIKSKLIVELFSDSTIDIDLVSQEIQLVDTRFNNQPVNKRSNVFTNILQPTYRISEDDAVQVEVHSRKHNNDSKFTILLNNMRLMAILDWWEAVRDFILEEPEQQPRDLFEVPQKRPATSSSPQNVEESPFELKLNITDSEIILLENTSQWDTNAVILKSTTVLSYKPHALEKPLSCNLNHCEMFSCVLGMEDETALSIIDPVTINMEVNKNHILEVQLQHLCVRLSYHDVMMFMQMLESIPKQTQWAKSHMNTPPANQKSQIGKLTALGFSSFDCVNALEQCNGQLDDAALWLTQHATAVDASSHSSLASPGNKSTFTIDAIEVKSSCLSICIIDDCRDADVPLLELSLSDLNIRQIICPDMDLSPVTTASCISTGVIRRRSAPTLLSGGGGWLECTLAGDYYNRVLSGWEPFIEPWKCEIGWEYGLTASLTRNRLQLKVQSSDTLNLNITSTLTELYRQVKDTWTQDYYNISPKDNTGEKNDGSKDLGSPPGYRRRSPFVPFALKNVTGSKLWFKTLITTTDSVVDENEKRELQLDESWIEVCSEETVPFTFEGRGKLRHRDTHKLKIHQLGVKVEGWQLINPVSVDKVGIYFRNTFATDQRSGDNMKSRIVFDVALEGSARKLVTVRSALQLTNRLKDTVEVRLETAVGLSTASLVPSGKTLFLTNGTTVPVPLSYVHAQMYLRPIDTKKAYMFCNQPVKWAHIVRSGDTVQELYECRSQRNNAYRFCVSIRRENYPVEHGDVRGSRMQPAHWLTFRAPVQITNLLPRELHCTLPKEDIKARIPPGEVIGLHEVDMERVLDMVLHIDNFPAGTMLSINPLASSYTTRLRLEDHSGRRLFFNITVNMLRGCGIEITVTVPYWIINKTGLPLVFRQEGVATETAGQFEEHEIARMVAPLLFSLVDPDASPMIIARVGSGVAPSGSPQWCQHFNLQPGIQTRKLRVAMRDNRPDIIFLMGIEKDPGAQATYLRAVPNCHMAFHWPRLDKEQLLCVRLLDIPNCCWSGGLRIDMNNSLHINIRDMDGRMYFLRLDVVLQGATFFIVFTDADTMPPPIRVDNYSEVSLTFAQACCKDIYRCTARAHSSVPYALDEPTLSQKLVVSAPGGVMATYDMNKLGEGQQLTYENFIYIAFSGTFKKSPTSDPSDIESQQLVLDVGAGGRIILARKQAGQRSQLWRMSSSGQLQHEGSSPPRPPQHAHSDKVFVLDIEGPAPQPLSYSALMLKRPDPRRQSTQTWRFTDDGRLCCAHSNMCVQAKDGFFGLREGSTAVLGMVEMSTHRVTETGIPLEQAVGRQRLRPGSGYLKVEISTDGPTKVLKIIDIKEKRIYATLEERDWANIAVTQRPNLLPEHSKDGHEFQLTIQLSGGVGVSLVSVRPAEELVFAHLKGIIWDTVLTSTHKTLSVSIGDIQIDNQLFEAYNPVLVHVTRPSRGDDDRNMKHKLPALQITAEVQHSPNENAVIFKHLIVTLKPLTVYLEELLLLKLFEFAGWLEKEQENLETDESEYEMQRILTEVASAHAKRYYFGIIKLVPNQIRLSMMTASKLPSHLTTIKRKLGLTFIKFEDAAVELEPFVKQHPFESSQFLINSILKHFKDELKWQAAIILGSVDFLGNPIGLVNDVSEGVTGLIYEGSVKTLVKNVTHGLSNSAAKVTESLSDGLGKVTMDDEHEEMRLRIRQAHSGSSGAHLVAGMKGFGFGILGGATGIFKQMYQGAANEGFPGFVSGIGKGVVGAVAKPVVGVLDLASETARAVRDSSRSSNRANPARCRPPRCVVGPGDLLPVYNRIQSEGQLHLHNINHRDYSELLIAYGTLKPADLRVIVSNTHVRFVASAENSASGGLAVIIETHLGDLIQCIPRSSGSGASAQHYIELTYRATGAAVSSASLGHNSEPMRQPRIRCDSQQMACWVTQQINYAKSMYEERQHTLIPDVHPAEKADRKSRQFKNLMKKKKKAEVNQNKSSISKPVQGSSTTAQKPRVLAQKKLFTFKKKAKKL